MVGQMTRSSEQILADQARQAAAEREQRMARAVKSPSGLNPLYVLQERLWGWHDMRQRSDGKYASASLVQQWHQSRRGKSRSSR
jgi:hypothetical protein